MVGGSASIGTPATTVWNTSAIARKSGKATGPYPYYWVRERGSLRSRYIGKTRAG